MKLPVNYDRITPQQRKLVREKYILLQDGKCWHCRAHLLLPPTQEVLSKKVDKRIFPRGFFKRPVHLHHNHETGMTVGAVHAYCNAVLWQYHNA